MKLNAILDLLDLDEPRPPYDSKEFVSKLSCIDLALSESYVLVDLAKLEILHQCPDFDVSKLIRLHDWALNSNTEHIRFVIEEIGMSCPILPALQKIILKVNHQFLTDSTPINNQSASVILKKQNQIEAMHMALKLMCYLGDSQSVALNKASFWIKEIVGEGSRGFSVETLEGLLENNRHHFLPFYEAEKAAMSDSELFEKVQELSRLIDSAR
ncbi:hypothetical protein XMG59_002077 [Marinobacterium sp. xm-g-59]|uniref:hypothetical protein n=1 Tax=Marinobacterium sp. xm-g-59 TaxID=2497748 RepID=UPI001569356C|nr:hypothetical protein [Marinobacterium sp. xm-g-59]NRP95959.1 hypothetical protein [Marinobacterium sp. xm-g-59]